MTPPAVYMYRPGESMYNAIRPTKMASDPIEDYICGHIDTEPEALKRIYRDTNMYQLYPRMCSGHLQGRVLRMLTQMISPRRVLELGTFTGYSALCMAEGMAPDGHLWTVEIDDEMEELIQGYFNASPWKDRIHLVIGDALEKVPELGDGPWDLVLIDANKRLYTEYYEMILPRVRKGGYILADNTLWDGKVTRPDECRDAQTKSIIAFNDLVASDTRVEKVILPLRDGLTLIRKI